MSQSVGRGITRGPALKSLTVSRELPQERGPVSEASPGQKHGAPVLPPARSPVVVFQRPRGMQELEDD
ncbi:hypothetical protein AAFF_G00000870 [Aldrovandia affinis]|uniref:Uncharacterized protein n=1 Tax=Aldrovandia affinis TaxID=143900 RepID=A0AAD7X3A9_9TELE|nr:hypothetical protein AAFF_G00000870 [Aldrovandia affinis]